MKSLPFTHEVWELKLKVLQSGGEAQTRRLLQRQPPVDTDRWAMRDGICKCYHGDSHYVEFDQKPHYHEGEVAYRPEVWTETSAGNILYEADCGYEKILSRWRSARFMPAWAARWFVQIVGPPVPQRVQEITPQECILEGIEDRRLVAFDDQIIPNFAKMWDSAYPKHPFSSNPFVWVYRIRLVPRP